MRIFLGDEILMIVSKCKKRKEKEIRPVFSFSLNITSGSFTS